MDAARLMQWLVIGAGGLVGAIARFELTAAMQRWSPQRPGRDMPLGTLLINVSGCLCIGLLMALADSGRLSDRQQKLLVTGFLGAFTTFSAFGFETVTLWQNQRQLHAAGYVALSVVTGLLACAGGLWLGRWMVRL